MVIIKELLHECLSLLDTLYFLAYKAFFFHLYLKMDQFAHKCLFTHNIFGHRYEIRDFDSLLYWEALESTFTQNSTACNLIKDWFMIHVHGKLKMFPLFYQQRICCKVNNQFMFPTNLVLASFETKTQIDSFVSVVAMYQLRYPKTIGFHNKTTG